MTSSNRLLGQRQRVLVVLMAAPVLATALGLGALGAWRFLRPDSPLFVTPVVDSLAEAIANDDLPRAYAFIRAGQDPNDPIVVRHPVLTDGRSVQLSPLLWAVANRREDAVPMLLAFGARMDTTAARQAVCLAERLGAHRIARILEFHGGGESREPCPTLQAGEAPLLEAVAEGE